MKSSSAILLAALTALPAPAARAVEAPFDAGLMRLSEILGSLHFLRNLCGDKGDRWRTEMEKLIAVEKPDDSRKAQFIANFNRGYRSFAGSYTSCTAAATDAIARYMKEGEALSRDITARYGN